MTALPLDAELPWLRPTQEAFNASLASGRLGHALLVQAAPGQGGEWLATWIAARMFCRKPAAPCGACLDCRRVVAGEQPDLLTLRPEIIAKLDLTEKLKDAVAEAKRITNFEGKRRQMQFIGKLMRKIEPEVLETVRTALTEQTGGSAQDSLVLHLTETWRDRLISEDDAFGEWVIQCPDTDAQQLRALIRQARKDAKPTVPGEAIRHGRAYRDIFQIVREHLRERNEAQTTDTATDSGQDDTP